MDPAPEYLGPAELHDNPWLPQATTSINNVFFIEGGSFSTHFENLSIVGGLGDASGYNLIYPLGVTSGDAGDESANEPAWKSEGTHVLRRCEIVNALRSGMQFYSWENSSVLADKNTFTNTGSGIVLALADNSEMVVRKNELSQMGLRGILVASNDDDSTTEISGNDLEAPDPLLLFNANGGSVSGNHFSGSGLGANLLNASGWTFSGNNWTDFDPTTATLLFDGGSNSNKVTGGRGTAIDETDDPETPEYDGTNTFIGRWFVNGIGS